MHLILFHNAYIISLNAKYLAFVCDTAVTEIKPTGLQKR